MEKATEGKAPSLRLPMAALVRVLERKAAIETDPALRRQALKEAGKAQEVAGREP